VNRPVNPSPAGQGGIRCVHDGVDFLGGDVTLNELKARLRE
jgi:hypothetical protein